MNKEKLLALPAPKNNLAFEQQKSCILSDLIDIVKEHYKGMDFNVLKMDIAFLERVCCLVETGIKKYDNKKYKFNKKQLVIDALVAIIPTLNSPEQIKIIDKNIENLHDMGKIVALKNPIKIIKPLCSLIKMVL